MQSVNAIVLLFTLRNKANNFNCFYQGHTYGTQHCTRLALWTLKVTFLWKEKN